MMYVFDFESGKELYVQADSVKQAYDKAKETQEELRMKGLKSINDWNPFCVDDIHEGAYPKIIGYRWTTTQRDDDGMEFMEELEECLIADSIEQVLNESTVQTLNVQGIWMFSVNSRDIIL